MEEVDRIIREGLYSGTMTEADCLHARELLTSVGAHIREQDVLHFWGLTCFWMQEFSYHGFDDDGILSTREGDVAFDKKGIISWLLDQQPDTGIAEPEYQPQPPQPQSPQPPPQPQPQPQPLSLPQTGFFAQRRRRRAKSNESGAIDRAARREKRRQELGVRLNTY
ncbi:hypothetical protein F5X98DRAFT_378766 [Xylaria grammica]|nr:hypothetical protein F5X98DRAFT_378766 [Xylaria grammica]